MTIRLLDCQLDWFQSFRAKHGRSPIVLHIGNIANNGYNNAKVLTDLGIDCDVICCDYYHIMSCPEWEEADFTGDIESQLYPAWEKVQLNNYHRPEWFAQGPSLDCLRYLESRRGGSPNRPTTSAALYAMGAGIARASHGPSWGSLVLRKARGAFRRLSRVMSSSNVDFHRRVVDLCTIFPQLFSNRNTGLTVNDFRTYRFTYPNWRKLLQKYDVAIAYATDGIFPLLADVCPYLAYEHGTIRHIPFADDAQGRLCALSYRLASGTFVTNCDNMAAAERLGLPNYCFVPHPINASSAQVNSQAIRAQWLQHHRSDFLLFHPSRHHWTAERDSDGEKGNDLLIQGFAQFVKRVNPNAHAIFVDWGNFTRQSKELIKSLGIASSVSWIEPQPNARMLGMIEASDCVADQFYLGTFGGITPKGLMLGKPTLLCFKDEVHRGCFESMPPVVNVQGADDIFHGLNRIYREPEFVKTLASEGRNWFAQHHSNERVARTLVTGMQKAIENWRGKKALPLAA
jgi:glycosyltransferase involved in cell wall biosynthesis